MRGRGVEERGGEREEGEEEKGRKKRTEVMLKVKANR